MNRQLSSIPSATNIVDDPQGPVWTHGSPRRQSNLEVERLWFGVASNTQVPGRSVRWMVTLIVPNINRFLPPSTFPTTRGVRFFNRMELLAIPQGEEDQGSSGMASTVSRYEYYRAYVGKNEGGSLEDRAEEWRRSFGMPARWPSMPSTTTSSASSTTRCQTGQQLFCSPKEPIQDINDLSFSPFWNTGLIFHLLFY